MTKLDFLYELREALGVMPREDIERYVDYYSEMIDDRIDDGMSEEDAVAEIGSAEDVAAKILGEPAPKTLKEETPKEKAPKRERGSSPLAITLIILGFPVWFPLVISAIAVLISLIAVLFSLVISVWAVETSLWGCAIGCLISGGVSFICGRVPTGLMLCGIAVFSAGLSVFMFYACKAATKGSARLTAKIFLTIKNLIVRKEERK